MKNFTIDTSPCGKKFFPKITESCFNHYFEGIRMKGSWLILYARIFELTYPDFLRMVRDVYGATLEGKQGGYISFYFSDLIACNSFLRELEKKFNAWKLR